MYGQFVLPKTLALFIFLLAPTMVLAQESTQTSSQTSSQSTTLSCSLSATPNTVTPGSSTKLAWNSTNAVSGAISTLGNVATSGVRVVNPNITTTYSGIFVGPLGTTTCSAKVTVVYTQNNYVYPGSSGFRAENPAVPTGGGGVRVQSGLQESNPVPIYSPQLSQTFPQSQYGLLTCSGIYDCNICSFGQLIQNIINFLIGLSIPIAVVMFAWAGILYFTSATSETNITRAKGIFKTVFIGFLIALTGWLVVQTVLSVLVKQDFYIGGHWNDLQCNSNQARPGVDYPVTVSDFLGTLPALQSYSTNSGAFSSCPPNATYDPNRSSCIDNATNAPVASVTNPYAVNPTTAANCSASAFASAGVNSSLAAGFSCLSGYESSCNNAASNPSSSAWGVLQVLRGYNNTGHNLNFTACSQAAQASGYTVNGSLNCSRAFGAGGRVVPGMESLASACNAAASNFTCNAQAAQWLYYNNGGWGNWAETRNKCNL